MGRILFGLSVFLALVGVVGAAHMSNMSFPLSMPDLAFFALFVAFYGSIMWFWLMIIFFGGWFIFRLFNRVMRALS